MTEEDSSDEREVRGFGQIHKTEQIAGYTPCRI